MKRRDAFLAALGLLLVWQILAMVVNLPILPAPVESVQRLYSRNYKMAY